MNNQIQLVLKSSTDEISLNDHELGIYLTPDLDGLVGLPEIRTTSGANAGYDGGWTSAQNYDARSITIKGVIANTDIATVEYLRKKLVSLAGQGKSEELTLDLVTEAGNAYTLQVRTIALDMAMQSVLNKQEFMLQLRADDPLIYDASETTHEALIQVAKATGGFQINFELPLAITGSSEETVVDNNGLERVPTITRLYGALHNPKIINHTTNQSMQLDTNLGFSEGQWINPSETVQGKTISIENAPAEAPLASFRLDGETSQNGTPTPSAPVPIKTTTGENAVKICRKNFVGLVAGSSRTISGVTLAINNNGNIIIDGTATANINITLFFATPTAPALDVEYTLSEKVIGGSFTIGTGGRFTINLRGGATPTTNNAQYNPYSVNWANGETEKTTSFTPTGAERTYVSAIQLITNSGDSFDNLELQLQLELGSATTYEPYQGQEYQVGLKGKNWLDISSFVLGGMANGNPDPNTKYRINNAANPIAVEPNTKYTISAQLVSPVLGYRVGIHECGVTGDFIRDLGWNQLGSSACTFTTGATTYYIKIVGSLSTTSTNVTTGSSENTTPCSSVTEFMRGCTLQFEAGESATQYEAYYNIELCKIGDYQDYIYKSGGKWYIHNETGVIAVDTSTITSSGTTYSNIVYGQVLKNDDAKNKGAYTHYVGLCSHAIWSGNASNWNSADNAGKCYDAANGSRYWIGFASGTSLDDIKTALSGCKIVYPLATSTEEEITNATLAGQLDALLNTARMYAGINNVFTTTSNERPSLELKYYTEKTPDYRDVIEIDSRLRTITLNGLDIYHLQTEGSDFLMLAPGENRLSLQSDITGDNGYAEVSYKQGYLSI